MEAHKIDEEMFNNLKQMLLSKDREDRMLYLGIIQNVDFTDKQTRYWLEELAYISLEKEQCQKEVLFQIKLRCLERKINWINEELNKK